MSLPLTPLAHLHDSSSPIHALAYSSPPSPYILTGSADRSIRLYNPQPTAPTSTHAVPPSKLIQTYSAHGYAVLDLSIAADNARFASCGGDRSVFLWDVSTAQTIHRFAGHSARVNGVCFAGAGDALLVSGSFDASVRVWDTRARSGRPVQVMEEARDSVACVGVMSGGGGAGMCEIVAGSVDGRVRYYDVRMGRVDVDVMGAPVTSAVGTADGQGVLVGTLDGTVRLMDRRSGGLLKAYKGHENGEFRIRSCFGGAEKWVVSGSERDGEVLVWDTLTGTVMQKVAVKSVEQDALVSKKMLDSEGREKARKNVITCVAWKNNGRGDQWCCAGTDGVVTVFGHAP